MPVYDFICEDCRQTKEVRATVAEKEKGLNVVCNDCGSTKMFQYFGNTKGMPFYPLH